VSGKLDISAAGLDPVACDNPTISGSLTVSGTWSATDKKAYTDGTTTSGKLQIKLPKSCLRLSGTDITCDRVEVPMKGAGFSAVTCTSADGGGCNCEGTVEQTGSIGMPSSDPQKSGILATSGNTLTVDGAAQYSYCVSGNKMSWTPKSESMTISGTIEFQKGGSGTGGAGGQGGQPGTGGGGAAGGKAGAGGGGAAAGAGGGGSTGGAPQGGSGGTPSGGGSGTRAEGPCDIYAAANTPCAAAYSTIRALSKTYTGPLYQVRKDSSAKNTGTGGTTKDIGQTADGFADTAAQDAFCEGTICTISLLYDHSGNESTLKTGTRGEYGCPSDTACSEDYESSATKGALTVAGHKVYSLYMVAHEGYRTPVGVKGKKMPLKTEPQGIYELADGTRAGDACCWDFGNVSTDPKQYHTMNTLFLGTGYWGKGAGSGPWFEADFEGGVWAGGSKSGEPGAPSSPANTKNPSMKVPFAFGILKTSPGPNSYAIRAADLQKATDLTDAYEGNSPMQMDNQGGVVLGVGGDNSNHSFGTFYEGAITIGRPSKETDLAVFKNVQAVGYGK
jgi:hypothetical protein